MYSILKRIYANKPVWILKYFLERASILKQKGKRWLYEQHDNIALRRCSKFVIFVINMKSQQFILCFENNISFGIESWSILGVHRYFLVQRSIKPQWMYSEPFPCISCDREMGHCDWSIWPSGEIQRACLALGLFHTQLRTQFKDDFGLHEETNVARFYSVQDSQRRRASMQR
jgi:hypothetical protein